MAYQWVPSSGTIPIVLPLLLAFQVNKNAPDWNQLQSFIDHKLAIAKDIQAFKAGLKPIITAFQQEHPEVDKFYLGLDAIKVQNSTWYLFSIGSEPVEGNTFVARPAGKTYRLEEVANFNDFRARHAVLDGVNLVVSGQEYSSSNAKHPAALTYRHWAKWVIANVQVASFEGGVDSFVKLGRSWTSYASGRTYPKHIDVPHGGAEVLMERTFRCSNGRLTTSTENFLPSVMHNFDQLIEASQRKDWTKVRSLCATASLASQFNKLTMNAPKQDWKVEDVDYQKMLACYIPKTDQVAVMSKVGKTWKLTKIRAAKF